MFNIASGSGCARHLSNLLRLLTVLFIHLTSIINPYILFIALFSRPAFHDFQNLSLSVCSSFLPVHACFSVCINPIIRSAVVGQPLADLRPKSFFLNLGWLFKLFISLEMLNQGHTSSLFTCSQHPKSVHCICLFPDTVPLRLVLPLAFLRPLADHSFTQLLIN